MMKVKKGSEIPILDISFSNQTNIKAPYSPQMTNINDDNASQVCYNIWQVRDWQQHEWIGFVDREMVSQSAVIQKLFFIH